METIEYKGHVIEITQDDCPENPRSWDNLGYFVNTTRHAIGDEDIDYPVIYRQFEALEDCGVDWGEITRKYRRKGESWDDTIELTMGELEQRILENPKPFDALWRFHMVALDVFIYEHSGIAMNCSGFSCPWDSGNAGFIYVSRDQIRQEFGNVYLTRKIRRKVTKILIGEVKAMHQYLSGDVWNWYVEFSDGDANGCSGYYGQADAISDAKAAIDWKLGEMRKAHFSKLKQWIRARVPFIYRKASPRLAVVS